MDISHVLDFIESRYRGTKVTPEDIEFKIREIVKLLDIFEDPNGMKIRFAFGNPTDDTSSLTDWVEDYCLGFDKLPDDVRTTTFTLYEIWYDSDEDEDLCGVEVMLNTK